ncbi:unnamed protein product [Diamesa serratosioi]
MDNEQKLLSFLELTRLPVDEAKQILASVNNDLNLAIQNYYNQEETIEPLPGLEEDEVRPAYNEIRETRMLIDDDLDSRSFHLSSIKRRMVDNFRDFRTETEIQENLGNATSSKQQRLEDIYRNPIDITYHLDLQSAKKLAEKQGKWIAIVINDENFPSLALNRDIFNEPKQSVKKLMKKNFIFLRMRFDDREGAQILQNYKLLEHSIPILMIIDSITGELRKNFGDTKDLILINVVKELKKYTIEDNQMKYSPNVIDSDDDDVFKTTQIQGSSTSNSNSFSQSSSATNDTSKFKPSTATKPIESDEESFASMKSSDCENSDNENGLDEPKILDSEDEATKEDESQTRISLRIDDKSHTFEYPSKRKVRNLINYIYQNYLLQTGLYDDKRNRMVLFSRIHNDCITNLDQEKDLEEMKLFPSIVLYHNVKNP